MLGVNAVHGAESKLKLAGRKPPKWRGILDAFSPRQAHDAKERAGKDQTQVVLAQRTELFHLSLGCRL